MTQMQMDPGLALGFNEEGVLGVVGKRGSRGSTTDASPCGATPRRCLHCRQQGGSDDVSYIQSAHPLCSLPAQQYCVYRANDVWDDVWYAAPRGCEVSWNS